MAYGNEVTTPADTQPSTTTALGLLAVAVALLVAAQLPSMRKNGSRRRAGKRSRMRKNGRVNLTRIATRIPDRELRLVQGELDFWLSPKRKALALAGPNRDFPVVKVGSQHLTVGEAVRLYPMIMRRIDAAGMRRNGRRHTVENGRRSYGPTRETTVEAAAAAGRLAGKKALYLFEPRYHSVVRTSRNWEKMANAAIKEGELASGIHGETYVLDWEKETAYIDAFAEVLQDASYNAMIDPDTYQHDERYENW